MCLIIHNPKAKAIDEDIIECALMTNPDGFGIFFHDTGEIRKTMDWQRPLDWMAEGRPFTAHFRYATSGPVKKGNCHPFDIDDTYSLMMNGTITGKGNLKESDSKVLARELGTKPRHTWKKELEQYDSRFVTVNTRNRTYQIYNKELWVQRDGIWYSKANVLEEHLVAVYGTLKRGHGNYYRHLTESKFIGKGKTKDKYPLIIKGLPYLIEEKGSGYNVEVEVFKVDDDTFADLDALEGHPRWYKRKQVPIKLADGRELTCWIYFNPHESSAGKQMHKSFDSEAYKPKQKTFFEPTPTIDLPELPELPDDREFSIEQEGPVCINCFHDLEYDFFSNYYCKSCGDWFREDEVIKFGHH